MSKVQLNDIEFFLLDMDGTIYLGDRLIDGSYDFLNLVKQQGKRYCFLTNNSSRGAEAYLRKLINLGIDAAREELVTSTDLLIYHLQKTDPGAVLYPVGTEQFEQELAEGGFNLLFDYRKTPPPDYVVIGFDTTLHYKKLFDVCRFVRDGVPYIATHPDLNCPLDEGVYMPDCGAIIEFVRAATEISPVKIVGKPNPLVIEYFMHTRAVDTAKMAIIGDRIYTDIRLGMEGNITSILVLSGESTREDAASGTARPDFVFDSIRDVYNALL